jgi:hypothetical protein
VTIAFFIICLPVDVNDCFPSIAINENGRSK